MKISYKVLFVLGFLSLYYFSNVETVVAGYGTSPASHSAPVCNSQLPGNTWITNVSKTGQSQIEINWVGADRATSWTVAYGRESGKYLYGISNFGDNNSRAVNINMLPSGTYYMVIKANNDCMPGSFSPERKVIVGNVMARTIEYTRNGNIGTQVSFPALTTPEAVGDTTQVAPTATVTATPEVRLEDPTPAPSLNIFQRIWKFLKG